MIDIRDYILESVLDDDDQIVNKTPVERDYSDMRTVFSKGDKCLMITNRSDHAKNDIILLKVANVLRVTKTKVVLELWAPDCDIHEYNKSASTELTKVAGSREMKPSNGSRTPMASNWSLTNSLLPHTESVKAIEQIGKTGTLSYDYYYFYQKHPYERKPIKVVTRDLAKETHENPRLYKPMDASVIEEIKKMLN